MDTRKVKFRGIQYLFSISSESPRSREPLLQILLIIHGGNQSPERLGNMPKVTQLPTSRVGSGTQSSRLPPFTAHSTEQGGALGCAFYFRL